MWAGMGNKTSNSWDLAVQRERIAWSALKDRIDLAAVATNLMGPASERRGRRLLWLCPFHDDRHPSFQVDLSRGTWRCWTCAVGGDAAELVMRINKCDFPSAVRYLADLVGVLPSAAPPAPVIKLTRKPPEGPTGLPVADASDLADESAQALRGPGGEAALDYLRGRGIDDETAGAAGLGYTRGAMVPTKAGDRAFWFSGITIPWRDNGRLIRLKIRRLDDGTPKYCEAFSDRPLIFPDPAAINSGKPLIIAEGEFDCLLLAQQLPEASVITLGSASARTDPAVISRMLAAPRWFVALDADQAGDSATAKFPARAIRVRPPDGKDWTELHRGGPNRIRYFWGPLLELARKWEDLKPKGDLTGDHD